jgi:hypothetical protein
MIIVDSFRVFKASFIYRDALNTRTSFMIFRIAIDRWVIIDEDVFIFVIFEYALWRDEGDSFRKFLKSQPLMWSCGEKRASTNRAKASRHEDMKIDDMRWVRMNDTRQRL